MATPVIEGKVGRYRYPLPSWTMSVLLAVTILISPFSLGDLNAATFKYTGTFQDVVGFPRIPPPQWDWLGGIWEVTVEGQLEQEVSLSSDQWIRTYSITSVTLALTFRYKTDCAQADTIIELHKHVLNTSNFNLAFTSWESVNDFNCSFISESKGIFGPNIYRYQIFLKYDEQAAIQTPRGSTLKLGGGRLRNQGGLLHQSFFGSA